MGIPLHGVAVQGDFHESSADVPLCYSGGCGIMGISDIIFSSENLGGIRMKKKGVLKEMKIWQKAVALTAFSVGCSLMVPGGAFAAENGNIPVDAAHFPDEAFRSVVSSDFDLNQDQVLDAEEIEQANYLYAHEKGIKDLTGVKYFTSLHTLWVQDNELTTIDVSGMDTLYEFWCDGNQLTKLNVAGTTNLNELSCCDNQLTTLDVTTCSNLSWLYCHGNKLTSLSLGGGAKLWYLDCTDNSLQSIDISKAADLENLRTQGNSFTTLNISASEYLKTMYQTAEPETVSGSSGTYYIYLGENAFDKLSFDAGVTIELTAPVSLDGWGTEDGHTIYIKNGVKVKGVQKISGAVYYFDKNGFMQTGWVTKSGNRYYFDEEGRMVTGSRKIEGKWYYFSSKGVMQTGWFVSGAKTFYFGEDGVRASGKTVIDGKTYYFNSKGIMQTGWLTVNKKTFYLNEDGTMQTGWLKLDGKYYRFNSKGVMITGWTKYKNNYYYLDETGAMVTNCTLVIDGTEYIFNKNGVCTNLEK